jgi:hypothetical protein
MSNNISNNVSNNINYYKKYLKYRQKYLSLRQQIYTGGGWQSALELFKGKVRNSYGLTITILIRDRDNGILNFTGRPTYTREGAKDNIEEFTPIFEQIRQRLKEQKNGAPIDNQNIDWIIKSYLTNTFGNPSSLENYGRYQEAIRKYRILYDNSDPGIYIKTLPEINGLIELEQYMDICEDLLREIETKKGLQEAEKEYQRQLKRDGERQVKVECDTPKLIIYIPQNEAGSKYYGRNTKWCTTSRENCRFEYYNRRGKLYIIQSRLNPIDKYQMHVETNQLMNSKDEPITFSFLKAHFDDVDLNRFIDAIGSQILDKFLKEINKYPQSTDIVKHNIREKKTKSVLFSMDLPLNDFLYDLTDVRSLFFYEFNQPLNDSFKSLINLEKLHLGGSFNQSLENSLDYLINLKELTFIWWNTPEKEGNFNQPLNTSFDKLGCLETLEFGNEFNCELEDSLDKLTNLKELKFGINFNNCEEPLYDSLDKLINLMTLSIKGYKQRLGYSLDSNSLDKLVNLRNLHINDSYIERYTVPHDDTYKYRLEYFYFSDEIRKRLCSINDKWIREIYL